jgi:hypothetical protein
MVRGTRTMAEDTNHGGDLELFLGTTYHYSELLNFRILLDNLLPKPV